MLDTHYVNPKLAQIYDLDNPWSVDREFYLSLAGFSPQKILDLGCGTGLLCNAYAENNHEVTGVDPSAAMLDVARQKPYAKHVEWVQSSAQTYSSNREFDLIVMTGHAFQALLNVEDVLATFKIMQKHLKADGMIAFESRNPAVDWQAEWNYDMIMQSPMGSVKESRRFVGMEKNQMLFELFYQFSDETIVSKSKLLFLSRDEIEKCLAICSLCTERILGDWDGKPFETHSSHEMIFIVRHSTSKALL